MVKKVANQRGRRTTNVRNRARRRRRTVRRRMPSLPPVIPMNAVSMNAVIRVSRNRNMNANEVASEAWGIHDAISNTPYKYISEVFSEFKIMRVNVWAIPSMALTAPGLAALCVQDNRASYEQKEFYSLASQPGTCVKRLPQVLHSWWVPTEPDDKNWFANGEDWKILHLGMGTTKVPSETDKSLTTLYWDQIFDIHIKARGVKNPVTKLTSPSSLDHEFVHLDIDAPSV